MGKFQQMTVFAAVADAQSFAAAGRKLDMSPPAVTRAIAGLEERLGVRLLTRTTRVVRPTDAGLRYLEYCRRILAEVDEADHSVAGLGVTPRGQLHVTAPVMFGEMYVTPLALEYMDLYPEATVAALLVDRVVNLVEEGLDVAIRIGDMPDSSLQAIRVGRVRRVICGSPRYFKAHGVPRTPHDLREHRIVASTTAMGGAEWMLRANGEPVAVKLAPRLTVTTNGAAIAAAAAGWGITRVLSYQITPQVQSGALRVVLESHEPPSWPVHVVHREERRSSPKVRAFVDLAVQRLKANLATV